MYKKHLKDLVSTVALNIISFICQNILLLTQTSINLLTQISKQKCQKILRTILFQINHSSKQQLEITGEFLSTDGRYKEFIIKLINKTQFFSFKPPKITEIARLYFFTSPGKKIHAKYKLEE